MNYGQLLGLRGSLHIDRIESAALAGNALGDPAARPLVVYTPPEYDAQGSRRYPVLYVLHGYTGDAAALIAARPWERNVVQWIDRLIVQGRMPPALLAIVDGFTRLGGSQYVDSIHNGDYAQYVTREVVAQIDASYRTIAREGGRAVLGKSSGGFGSLHLVMEHPGIFAAFASHSGDAYFTYAYPPAFASVQRTLEKHDFSIPAFVEAFEAKHKRAAAEYSTMEMLGYTAAYTPRSAKAFDLDLPFDLKTGELREEIFARWRAFDPAERAGERKSELERLRLRYLDCGRKDEYALDVGARLVTERIRALGLAVRHEEFDDDHRNVGYRYEISLPALADVLDKD
ncbi:MAG TPA: alpha/beta hydrolase-fold protein [Candidatus Acidoferrales bacterium]|nr:alpha/beta hydrolase-fold protein [Candidatus Acidoferrales bacterium]